MTVTEYAASVAANLPTITTNQADRLAELLAPCLSK
jgi:hypothetical protein